MKKAVLFSLLVHALALGAIFLSSRARDPLHAETPASAPIGDVFVSESPAGPAPAEAPGTDGMEESAVATSPASRPGIPDGEAEPTARIEPGYPPLSRKLGEEGESVFQITVEADGSVSRAELETSSGHSRLDEAARTSLLNARFRPARRNQAPSASTRRFRIEFRLQPAAR